MSSLDERRPVDMSIKRQPLSGVCQGGPKNGLLHATLAGRRTPMDGGAYVYRAGANGHHLGTWVWLAGDSSSEEGK